MDEKPNMLIEADSLAFKHLICQPAKQDERAECECQTSDGDSGKNSLRGRVQSLIVTSARRQDF